MTEHHKRCVRKDESLHSVNLGEITHAALRLWLEEFQPNFREYLYAPEGWLVASPTGEPTFTPRRTWEITYYTDDSYHATFMTFKV